MPAGAATTVIANQYIREEVRLLSGSAVPAQRPRMTGIDLRSLRTQSHTFLPHPFELPATSQGQEILCATIERLDQGAPIDPDEFVPRVAHCLQRRFGVLGEATERDFTQIPLAVSQVEVTDPALLLGPDIPLPVAVGAGVSLDDARRAAVLRGLATYGSLMVDPRRMHVGPDVNDIRTGDPSTDLAALRAGKWEGLVWGYSLADGAPCELPASTVFPAVRGADSTYGPPVGVAAGYDWADAVHKGLVARCRSLTVTEIGEGRCPATPIDWTELDTDARGAHYRSMASITGRRLEVFDVSGSLGVPVLAFNLDGITLAYAAGFSFAEALRDGLAEVLLSYQAETHGEAEYAPTQVMPLPMRGRSSAVVACPTWATDSTATVARLKRLGWTTVAFPLDHDPGLTASMMPYLVNVVITRA